MAHFDEHLGLKGGALQNLNEFSFSHIATTCMVLSMGVCVVHPIPFGAL